MSYQTKKQIYGFLFILPWFIGFLLFFAQPFVESFKYAFQKLEPSSQGFVGTYVGLDNFKFAIFRDTAFLRECVNSLGNLIQVPLILIYSIAFALLIKGKYTGRSFMRAVAFLPVIIGSGVLMQIIKEDVFSQGIKGGNSVYLFASGGGLQDIFVAMGLNQGIINFINRIISQIFDLTWRSGVQIMLFLAGLHNIPEYVYEAASLEGAREFEKFFKVTLPLLTPMILLNTIYSVIDSFSDYGNQIIQMIYSTTFDQVRLGYASALSIIYFFMIIMVLGLVYFIIRKYIVSPDE
ncbi:MAG: sugar transporter permease [Lachnospiraceae bacterium]|jgi:ABC-type sugar transport system permease subunit|nr:sugar transporter permease [Anaerocolumna sp.]MDF2609509.1 sugar transporter permease [Lachnospiraceae bacterium]